MGYVNSVPNVACKRMAGVIVFLMILAPITNATTTNWTGPSPVNPQNESITVNGFNIHGNASILDGWVHVTNSDVSDAWDSTLVIEGVDLLSGSFDNVKYDEIFQAITMIDDGSLTNISTFDEGDVDVSMNDIYTYSPGWEHVYSIGSSTTVVECNNLTGSWVDHGYDNNVDGSLSPGETTATLMYCSGNALEDSITTLNITNGGSGYTAGTLSATGGAGSGFSGTYTISSAINSVSISDGGSGYQIGDSLAFVCPGGCFGSGASASVGSVASNGSITSVTVNNGGSGYTSQTMYLLVSSSGGSGASLSAVLETTGSIYEAFVTDGGSGYTSSPTIVISSSGGSSANITAGLGGFFDYEVSIDSITAGSSANCTLGGYVVNAGMDTDDDSMLDTTEISDTNYLCNIQEMWGATTFNHNGTILGDEQMMSYGTIPSSASEGIVAVGTMPGSAVPRGTSSSFLLPQVDLPDSDTYNGLYMTFDHWYHLDSTASGDGDGTWIEYRINTGSWNDWTYIAPDGGYPSTMSTEAPSPNGAPSGVVPVFASNTHSGWLSDTISMSSISDIDNASQIQFRFHIWTSPNASYERPGWFLDNIDFNNHGVNTGVWHHGCISTTGSACQYVANSYGALQRTIDLSGTNSTSSIEIDMEWDLQGSTNDNACIELSLNNVTWYDISSASSSTTSDCEDRSGAIPGYPSYDSWFGDESNGIRTVEYSIPSAYQNQANVYIRFVVDTDAYTNYGGNYPGDTQEGFTLEDIRVVDESGIAFFRDDLENPNTMIHYSVNNGYDDWAYYTLTLGTMEELFNFENSTASDPTSSNAPGWSKDTGWDYGQLGPSAGPDQEPSFPYVYGTNLNGNYANNQNSLLTSPTYTIPEGSAYLTFDKWICTENSWDAVGLQIQVNGGSWNYFDPQIPGWYDGSPGYSGNQMYGHDAWMAGDCGQTNFENRNASLSNYTGDELRFRFRLSTDTSVTYQGAYIDNFGISMPNYTAGFGSWTSPPIDITSVDYFNPGWVDVDAIVPNNTSITATLIDSSTGAVVNGLEDVTFPISLEGVDITLHGSVKVEVTLDTTDSSASPIIDKITIGGKRYLSADSFDINGWNMSTGVEVVDGLLNATTIGGTITSNYIHSSRPINSIDISGIYSSSISVTAYDVNDNQIGTSGTEGVEFNPPVTGFSLSIDLPTNGWIDRMVMTTVYAEHANNLSVDILDDGSTEWAFSMGDDYGYYGWQSLISGGSGVMSSTLDLDGTNPASVTVKIPTYASSYGGIIAVSSQSINGFAGAVSVSVEGVSQSSGSENYVFYNTLDIAQLSAINAQGTSHTDNDTGREWRDITIEVDSNSAQTVSLSRLGIGYLLFENVTGIANPITTYHGLQILNDPSSEYVEIPVNISAEMGSLSIDGVIVFTFDADGDGWDYGDEIACGTDPDDMNSVPLDTDSDGICNPIDDDDDDDNWLDYDEITCGTQPLNATSVPLDTDGDFSCDIVDSDDDNDGLTDNLDECPVGNIGWTSDSTTDYDSDGCFDFYEDTDDDNDSIADAYDNCPVGDIGWISANSNDYDSDGCHDSYEDTDDDNDGVADNNDSCPTGELGWTSGIVTDNDGDGCKDSTEDWDDDNDGIMDLNDAFPLDASAVTDTDGDGMPDELYGPSTTGLVADWDDDDDGLSDNIELNLGTNKTNADTDGDNYNDFYDEFPLNSNEWSDSDSDGIGDNADLDDDDDGWSDNLEEICLTDTLSATSVPLDTDGDGLCDVIDVDDDDDLVPDFDDAFPLDSSEWDDTDGDAIGNNIDQDDDGDWVPDFEDAFPLDSSEWDDTDGDGIGDNADQDDDDDLVPDLEDAFPLDSSEWNDTDGDAIGDNADQDDDGDWVPDFDDAFPLDSSEWDDTDGDGIGDNADQDDDGDDWSDALEEMCLTDALSATSVPLDTDSDGICDTIDEDDDDDLVPDFDDAFPLDSKEWEDLNNDRLGDNGNPLSIFDHMVLNPIPTALSVLMILVIFLSLTMRRRNKKSD